ncbi:DUF2521 family protein [Bacillus sonorensis]|nr:DUF2521 family protein [Bacillus sonorensis]
MLYDGCIDFAIEAYLLGAQFGKFGYYGESVQKAMTRSEQEEKQLLHELYEYALSWSEAFNITISHEGLYYACEHFIQTWWKEGFSERKNASSSASDKMGGSPNQNHISFPCPISCIKDKREERDERKNKMARVFARLCRFIMFVSVSIQ